MSAIDGQDLFSSGPHTIRPLGWERALVRRGLPGLDGELVLDLGLRSRAIVQAGRLQAGSEPDLRATVTRLEGLCDGRAHALTDCHGRTFRPVVVEHFELTAPIQRGRGFWCEYALRYRELP